MQRLTLQCEKILAVLMAKTERLMGGLMSKVQNVKECDARDDAIEICSWVHKKS